MNYIISSTKYSVKCEQISNDKYKIYNMEGDIIAEGSSNQIPQKWVGAIKFLQEEPAAESVNLDDGVMVAEA
mgnify:CR=1 FL=1